MEKLSFHPIGSNKKKTIHIMILVLIFSLVTSSLLLIGSMDKAVMSINQLLLSLVCNVCWLFIWDIVKDSISDAILEKRIRFIMYLPFFSLAISLFEHELDWLGGIGSSIISLLEVVYYFKIVIRCIKKGDEQVKKFGKLLILAPVCVLICLVLIIVSIPMIFDGVSIDFMTLIGVIIGILVVLSCIYPFFYFYKVIGIDNTNSEEKNTQMTANVGNNFWWWIVPLCALAMILLMSQAG